MFDAHVARGCYDSDTLTFHFLDQVDRLFTFGARSGQRKEISRASTGHPARDTFSESSQTSGYEVA